MADLFRVEVFLTISAMWTGGRDLLAFSRSASRARLTYLGACSERQKTLNCCLIASSTTSSSVPLACRQNEPESEMASEELAAAFEGESTTGRTGVM